MDARMMTWRWQRNPLLRRSDIAERWMAVITILLMAVLAPLAGILVATGVATSSGRQERDRHPATAVLTKDAALVPTGTAPGGTVVRARAPVRWEAPDHSTRTAVIQVSPDARAGTGTVIWTDSRGRIVHRPPTPSQTELRGSTTGAGAAGGVCLLLLGARLLTVKVTLDRYRARAREREWSEVAPRWTHRTA
ncbi:hypothetical protein [Streptomyces luteireticuli]|uniref:Rv1733c family protein n=1 Tax=Streptomyces luteireticuli TaxID=173858 RepID=UPI0035561FEF